MVAEVDAELFGVVNVFDFVVGCAVFDFAFMFCAKPTTAKELTGNMFSDNFFMAVVLLHKVKPYSKIFHTVNSQLTTICSMLRQKVKKR
jgi:hypothetical protein